MNPILRCCAVFFILGLSHAHGANPDIRVTHNSPHPQLTLKSMNGFVAPRKLSGSVKKAGKAERRDAVEEIAENQGHGEGHAEVQEKSESGIIDALVLGLPVLFLPALLLALLYLIWAGSYSSYNYHNNYPHSYGTQGGSAVGFGHYGNGLQGPHHHGVTGHGSPGTWRKTDRSGSASKANLTQSVDQLTPSILSSIHKLPLPSKA